MKWILALLGDRPISSNTDDPRDPDLPPLSNYILICGGRLATCQSRYLSRMCLAECRLPVANIGGVCSFGSVGWKSPRDALVQNVAYSG